VLGTGAGAALPVIRIVAPEGNYDYQNKYFTDVTEYHCPAACRPARSGHPALVLKAYRVLGCRGWGRADVMIAPRPQALPAGDQHLARHDRPFAGAHGGARAGISYEDLCLRLLDAALDYPRGGEHERPALPFDVRLMNFTTAVLVPACCWPAWPRACGGCCAAPCSPSARSR
jgi:D-alanine-D-alanine ligase